MYPKNAASPEEILVGQVILIADGSVVTASASVRTKGQGGSWGAGGGTLACDSTSGAWSYIPTQAETNFTSFIVAVYKASCIGCGVTVVTTASAVPGRTMPDAAYDAAKTAAQAGDIMKVSSGTGANQISLSSGKVAATIASGDAVGLPAAAAGAKGGLPILDASTGLVLTGYGPAPVTVAKAGDKMDLIDAPNATALTAIGTAVWATTTRTLSSFGTLVADVATAVWGATTRTLSAFGFGTPTGEGK